MLKLHNPTGYTSRDASTHAKGDAGFDIYIYTLMQTSVLRAVKQTTLLITMSMGLFGFSLKIGYPLIIQAFNCSISDTPIYINEDKETRLTLEKGTSLGTQQWPAPLQRSSTISKDDTLRHGRFINNGLLPMMQKMGVE